VGICKPEPAIYHLLLQRTGLRASDCLFIDDSPANTAGAARLGFQTHLFTSPAELRFDLEQRGLLTSDGERNRRRSGV
jgi:FMN phosphatase YigB (HAD superfamily)